MNDIDAALWIHGLLADLDGLAQLWATFQTRHADDDVPPQPAFAAGLEICADQLRESITRARQLAPEGWQLSNAAMSARLTDA